MSLASLSLIPGWRGEGWYGPDRLQKGPHASRVGLVVEVGGDACLHGPKSLASKANSLASALALKLLSLTLISKSLALIPGLDHVCAMNPARMAKPTSMPFVRDSHVEEMGRQAHAVYGRLSVSALSALLTSCDFLLVFIMLLSE